MSTDPFVVSFVAGNNGPWRIDRLDPVVGESLPLARRLQVTEGTNALPMGTGTWALRGVVSNTRYTTRAELNALGAKQEALHRPRATHAALIPIRKTTEWWALAQDERRSILEEQSRHIAIGLEYLPSIARRLHHSREFGEPFDFLTWFEFEPKDSDAFEELVLRLRQTTEWKFVDREVDIRLSRE